MTGVSESWAVREVVMNNLQSVDLKLGVGALQFVSVNIYVDDGVFDFNIFCALESGFSGFFI